MSPEDFDRLVEESLSIIPARFRKRLKNIVFIVERESPRRDLLGLYEGTPLTERGVADPIRLPDRITIFQGPHERQAKDERSLRRLVEETIWHEVAHYFGLDERQVLLAERRRQGTIRRLKGL